MERDKPASSVRNTLGETQPDTAPGPTDARPDLPPGWRRARLGEVCEINPRRPPDLERRDDAPTTFIPMSAVDGRLGTILRPEVRRFAQVRKGYTYFGEGDVLFAKITPCMQNGKHVIARGLIEGMGFGTTEFHVLRPGPDAISEWIHFYLRQRAILEEATAHFIGSAGQQRLPDSYLSALQIPFPPLEEQKRIAGILTEQMGAVERARAATEAQLKAAKALPAAHLRAVFNTPEARKWARKRLGEICEIVARQVDPRLPEYAALPHVSGENIEGGLCRLSYLNTAAQDGMTSGKYLFDTGDVLYSKLRPYLRKVVVVDFQGVCSADMYPIRVNRDVLDPHFTAWMLVSDDFTKYADEESRRARMPKLNREQLFAWNVPVPPMQEQQRIVARLADQMAAAEKTRKVLEEQLTTINALPAALLRRAFSANL